MIILALLFVIQLQYIVFINRNVLLEIGSWKKFQNENEHVITKYGNYMFRLYIF